MIPELLVNDKRILCFMGVSQCAAHLAEVATINMQLGMDLYNFLSKIKDAVNLCRVIWHIHNHMMYLYSNYIDLNHSIQFVCFSKHT